MRIFVAGASGAIGRRLVPLLVEAGHQVVASTRSSERTAALEALGAQPVVVDGLDRAAVVAAVVAARPDAVVHQMTALAGVRNLRRFDEEFALTNRLRTDGTDFLLAAAREAGAERFIAQSYTGWPYAREGGRVKAEDDPLDEHPPATMARTLAAIRRLEATVLGAADLTGIVLRYGSFYGPGTSVASDGAIVEAVRRRQLPVVGSGDGIWSFVHIDDAARATRAAIELAPSGIYNIVDDEPAEVAVWLPELARALGAPRPYHVPAWIGRLVVGDAGVSLMSEVRGASNAKARRVLRWKPQYSSWRDGFRRFREGNPVSTPGSSG